MWLVDGAATGLLILVSLVRLVRKILGVGVLVEGAGCKSIVNNLGFYFWRGASLESGLKSLGIFGLKSFWAEAGGLLFGMCLFGGGGRR